MSETQLNRVLQSYLKREEPKEEDFGAGVYVFVFLPLHYASRVWRCHVLSVLWGWFAVPFLHLPPIGLWPMFGLYALANLLIWTAGPVRGPRHTEKQHQVGMLIYCWLEPLMALATGAVARWFL